MSEYELIRGLSREEITINDAITWERFLEVGVDGLWIARSVVPDTIVAHASDYWVQDFSSLNEGTITYPTGADGVGFYTRKAYKNPVFCLKCKIPSLPVLGNRIQFGFNNGGGGGSGSAFFTYQRSTAVDHLYANFGNTTGVVNNARISAAIPVDYKTAFHTYTIEVNKNIVFYLIDGDIVAIAINSSDFVRDPDTSQLFRSIPYGLTSSSSIKSTPISSYMTAFLEVRNNDVPANIAPHSFRVSDGEAIKPRFIPLYVWRDQDRTKMAGQTGTITSHWFPVFGYEKKTVIFMADQAGTLLIETYSAATYNTWRTYSTTAIVANTYTTVDIPDNLMIARVKWTPDAPATILEADYIVR